MRVDDVDEQVGVGGHLERGLERLDQLVGQLADEADGVGEQHRLAAGQLEPAGGGVERGEEPVLDQHAGVGEAVQQRRLAGVGVADDGDVGAGCAGAALRWVSRCRRDVAQLGLELVDPAHHAAPVDLELGLAGTTGADARRRRHAAGLLGQRRPLPRRRGRR